jgi:hypothetical protein
MFQKLQLTLTLLRRWIMWTRRFNRKFSRWMNESKIDQRLVFTVHSAADTFVNFELTFSNKTNCWSTLLSFSCFSLIIFLVLSLQYQWLLTSSSIQMYSGVLWSCKCGTNWEFSVRKTHLVISYHLFDKDEQWRHSSQSSFLQAFQVVRYCHNIYFFMILRIFFLTFSCISSNRLKMSQP